MLLPSNSGAVADGHASEAPAHKRRDSRAHARLLNRCCCLPTSATGSMPLSCRSSGAVADGHTSDQRASSTAALQPCSRTAAESLLRINTAVSSQPRRGGGWPRVKSTRLLGSFRRLACVVKAPARRAALPLASAQLLRRRHGLVAAVTRWFTSCVASIGSAT